jgi:hypothetical protein
MSFPENIRQLFAEVLQSIVPPAGLAWAPAIAEVVARSSTGVVFLS